MDLYHETEKDKLGSVLVNGLRQGSGGNKRDAAIYMTERFLNGSRSRGQIELGLDRLKNIYCYLADDTGVIDITTGQHRRPHELSTDPTQTLIKISPRPDGCFVSDLDLFDQIKACLQKGDRAAATKLASAYWQHLVPLESYDGSFRRPEVMLTYDVEPADITAVQN